VRDLIGKLLKKILGKIADDYIAHVNDGRVRYSGLTPMSYLYHEYHEPEKLFKVDSNKLIRKLKTTYTISTFMKIISSKLEILRVIEQLTDRIGIDSILLRCGITTIYNSQEIQLVSRLIVSLIQAGTVPVGVQFIGRQVYSSENVLFAMFEFYTTFRKHGSLLGQPWTLPVEAKKIRTEDPVCPADFDSLACDIVSDGNTYLFSANSNIHSPNIFGSVIRISGTNGSGKSTLFGIIRDCSWVVRTSRNYINSVISKSLSLGDMPKIFCDQNRDNSFGPRIPEVLLSHNDVKARRSHLSPGQHAKFICGKLMELAKPDTILMFDEPSAPMDKEGKEAFWRKLDEVRKEHITFIISHEIPEWFKCDYEIGVSVKLKQD
jgi:ABC-type lipoprotein export system ATPase subunit